MYKIQGVQKKNDDPYLVAFDKNLHKISFKSRFRSLKGLGSNANESIPIVSLDALLFDFCVLSALVGCKYCDQIPQINYPRFMDTLYKYHYSQETTYSLCGVEISLHTKVNKIALNTILYGQLLKLV